MNSYQPYAKRVTNDAVDGYRVRGSATRYGTDVLGSSTNKFTSSNSRFVECLTANVTNIVRSDDGPFTLSSTTLVPSMDDANRIVYSASGSVANINTTATTFSTNATGECGLFFVYTASYTASCYGQYNHTASPKTYISTGSPALVVTISGSNLQVAFGSSTTPATVYWKKLKFN